jgi:tripartite-type tricarboxylate transporter receptor subunit TctC
VSNTILAVGVKKDAPYNTLKEFTEAARKAPNTINSGLVQGITEFTFWGYQHHEKLEITQVPYRDINQAPTDLGEGRIQIVMSSFSTLRPQYTAGRLKLLAVNNKTPVEILPGLPTARAAGFPSLEVEGLVGVFGTKTVSNAVKEKIAADVKAVSVADGLIADRLKATGQVMNVGGPKEFSDSIAEQHNNVSAVVKAINFKPKN